MRFVFKGLIFDSIVKAGKCKEFCDLSNWALSLVLANLKEWDPFVRPTSRCAIQRIVLELDAVIKSCDPKKSPVRMNRLEELKSKFAKILNLPNFKQATKLEVAQEHKPETQVVAEVIPATNNEQRKA